MKKILIYLLCFALVLGSSVTAFAITPYSSSLYSMTKSSGLKTFNYAISLTNKTNFALWQISPVEHFAGDFEGTAENIAGTEFYLQNKPFGNTDFSQSSAIGDIVRTGYYMPIDAFPLNVLKIRTQIDIGFTDGSTGAIVPDDGASGEFAIGFVDRNGVLIDILKDTADYTCNKVYGKLRYVGSCSFLVKFKIPAAAVGFVVYSTAYDLYGANWATTGTSNQNISISNSSSLYISYDSIDMEDAVVPIPPAGGGSVGDLDGIENGLKDSASGGLSSGLSILDQFKVVFENYTPAFLAVKDTFDCFVNIPFFGVLVLMSCAIGILPIILNIGLDVGRWGVSRDREAQKTKERTAKEKERKSYAYYAENRSRRESYADRYNRERGR